MIAIWLASRNWPLCWAVNSMDEKKRMPEIRFPGFTGPWEQRKLGEVVQVNPSSVLPDSFEYVDLESVVGTEIVSHRTENKAMAPSRAQRLARYGDIFFQMVRPYQKNNYLFELPDKDYVFSTGYAQLRPRCSGRYLFSYLQRDLFVGRVLDRCTGTGYPAINAKDLANLEIALPRSENEQHLIGSFFRDLDNLIALHQRKHEKLCKAKTALSGKMFPKPGETEPDLRFPGFTGPWEQRKLGDCFEFLKNNTLSRAGLNGENGTARNVHYGDILIKFGDCLDGERNDLPFITDDTVLPKFAGSILREGDVIFADTAEDEAAGKCVELRKLPKEPAISGLHTIPARPRFPFGTGYLGHYLNSDAYHRQLLPLMQGIKVISVSKAALQDTEVRFPGLSEQTAIGAALSGIDTLITLHQRKLETLRKVKKSLLEKMFA